MSSRENGAILAIDGGGTTTRAGLYMPDGTLLGEAEAEGSNPYETSPGGIVRVVSRILQRFESEGHPKPTKLVAGIAGMGRSDKRDAIAHAILHVLEFDSAHLASDAYALFAANCNAERPILVIAGTGSCVIARRNTGKPLLVGGGGPIIGDDGSAYGIAVEALHESMFDSQLRAFLLAEIPPKNFAEISEWIRIARKSEVAALARTVIACAEKNPNARAAVVREIGRLLVQVAWTIELIGLDETESESTYPILCHGGMFEHHQLYREQFQRILMFPNAEPMACPVTGHRAALSLLEGDPDAGWLYAYTKDRMPEIFTTESRLSIQLDEMTVREIADEMSEQDLKLASQLVSTTDIVGELIDRAATSLREGGRIIYVGAGTSGRLGVLDAAECPPTFGVSEDRVIALIAGGDAALRHSIEGAEDDTDAAVRDLEAIVPPIGRNDIVIGITASGTTPYPLAAIDRAKEGGCATALICCNPVPLDRADIVIALDTGPEILPGSTRLKAGTGTKMVLNQISTGAMAKAGYVFEGRMVGVRPVNMKLRGRCIRIIAELTGESLEKAETRLDETDGSIPLAVLMARMGLSLDDARARLEAANGILRDALEAS